MSGSSFVFQRLARVAPWAIQPARRYPYHFGSAPKSGNFIPATFVLAASALYCFGDELPSSCFNRSAEITRLDAATTTAVVDNAPVLSSSTTALVNWSGTHRVEVADSRFWEPSSIEEVEKIIRECHQKGYPVRPLGSALSPNGIAFQGSGMISMANLDRVVKIDPEEQTVTVQAGARVSQVVDALRPYRLTLPNLASIAEQQMGGFVQVGAHGTGRCIAPVDHYVRSLKLVTPRSGTLNLSEEDGELFQMAKVGLGCLGVVVEITIECIPAHKLVEHTFVLTRAEAKAQVHELLTSHKHMRYMWIPYTDAVVVVTNDPEDQAIFTPKVPHVIEKERFQPLRDLLLEVTKDSAEPFTNVSMKGMGFGELRDALLAVDPLNLDHVKRCNAAEAEFWRRSEGIQIKPSDQLLQFDCGGQQWVWEVCFPTGTEEESNGNDMQFMEDLLNGIEEQGIPAHSPIEQRWTSSSSSLMSPAHGQPGGLHSWVGIINYLPSDDETQRREITTLFRDKYCSLMRRIGQPFNATSHWAKLELPKSLWEIVDLRLSLESRFPLTRFNETRRALDPKNILGSPTLDQMIGKPS